MIFFLFMACRYEKEGLKLKKIQKNIKNINKEDFLHQAQVHSSNYKKGVKLKSTPVTIKRESSQGEKTHRVLEHSNTHLKLENSPLGNSFFSFIIFYSFFPSLLLHQFLYPFSSISPLWLWEAKPLVRASQA